MACGVVSAGGGHEVTLAGGQIDSWASIPANNAAKATIAIDAAAQCFIVVFV